MDKTEEKAFIQRLVSMDREAWKVFCNEFTGPLVSHVRLRFGVSQEQAEDIVQMTFVRCVRSIRTFNPSRGRLFSWLKAVAANESYTSVRKDLRNPLSATQLPGLSHTVNQIIEFIDESPLPDEVLARKDVQMAIQEALLQMNTRHRQALVAKYVEGLKVSEIAERMNVSEKAAESILSRSRESFRRLFINTPGSLDTE